MIIKLINSISEVSIEQWNGLLDSEYPFIYHEFLTALEDSRSVSQESGWCPQHCLVFDQQDNESRDNKTLIAAMPLYKKNHSHGEYVFDQNWANAYQEHGIDYFPKWVTAIPFTPCEGSRLLVKNGYHREEVFRLILNFIKTRAGEKSISSWHCLFPHREEIQCLKNQGLSIREGVQFRWSNRGYSDFENYLSTFKIKKKKNIRRERRWVKEQNIKLIQLKGSEITSEQWQAFYRFYQMTYFKRRMQPYLNLSFFHQLAETMADQILLIMAVKDKTYVGSAFSLVGGDTLYGRYWGCLNEYHSLHFEACYYQGLEYCIENNLQYFDSGAQGEHKISRGFEAITTYSAHWIKDPTFASAIDNYVRREALVITKYKHDVDSLLPFKMSHKEL